MFRPLALSVLLATASCGDFPRDPEDTLQRVRSEHNFRVGLVASGNGQDPDPLVLQFLRTVGSSAQAKPAVTQGETEALLTSLEKGELDLVIGHFDPSSPWAQRVTFGPELRSIRRGDTELLLAPAMRNGENAWIGLVARRARDASQGAQ